MEGALQKHATLVLFYSFSVLIWQSRWRKHLGSLTASSEPFLSRPLTSRVVPTGSAAAGAAGYNPRSPLRRSTAAFWVFCNARWMILMQILPPSVLCPPFSSPSFPMCTEIGFASVLCRSVTVPFARLLSKRSLLVFYVPAQQELQFWGGGY